MAMSYAHLPLAPACIWGIIIWGYHGLMFRTKWIRGTFANLDTLYVINYGEMDFLLCVLG